VGGRCWVNCRRSSVVYRLGRRRPAAVAQQVPSQQVAEARDRSRMPVRAPSRRGALDLGHFAGIVGEVLLIRAITFAQLTASSRPGIFDTGPPQRFCHCKPLNSLQFLGA